MAHQSIGLRRLTAIQRLLFQGIEHEVGMHMRGRRIHPLSKPLLSLTYWPLSLNR